MRLSPGQHGVVYRVWPGGGAAPLVFGNGCSVVGRCSLKACSAETNVHFANALAFMMYACGIEQGRCRPSRCLHRNQEMLMKTLWMDSFLFRTRNAAHGPVPVKQTGRRDRLAFWPSEQEVA